MPLGTEVGLGLRDIVFDVDPATPKERAHLPHPIFDPCLLWPNGWMDEDAAWYRSDLDPGHIVLDGVPPPAKGAQHPPPLFGPCLLWPRSPMSATAELLFTYLWMQSADKKMSPPRPKIYGPSANKESLYQIPFCSMCFKLPVIRKLVYCLRV